MPTTNPITAARLRELLNYDPETGIFTWRVSRRPRARAGGVAGKHCHGYIRIGIDGRVYRAHHLAFLRMTGRWPRQQVDHENHIRDDNRWCNLRDNVDDVEQQHNRAMSRTNSSGTAGVYWNKHHQKWQAQISVERKRIHLGYFAEITDAIAARKAANLKYGFHRNHGKELV